MDDRESSNHSALDCKYRVVFIPKYRKRHCMASFGKALARFSESLLGRKHARLKKGI